MSTWVFVGDSVTAAGRDPARPDDLGRGWVSEVARRLCRLDHCARVVNLGVSGDRVADVRDRIAADMAAAAALVPGVVVTVAVGVNDVRRAHLDGEPLDIGAVAATYAGLLVDVRSAVPEHEVRFVLVEPVLAPSGGEQQRWLSDLDRVVDVVRATAGSTGSVLVGAGRTLRRLPALEVARDGVHPTAAGHRLLAEAWLGPVQAAGLLPRGRPARWWDRLRRT